jgi:hypothetical protein
MMLLVGMWLHLFLEVLEKHTPLKEKRVKHPKFPDWWSEDISNAINLRDATSRSDNPELFKSRRNEVTRLIRESRKDFYTTLLDKGRTAIRSFWQHFREVLPTNVEPSPLELCMDYLLVSQ